jgi:hypothetical protein
MFIRDIKKLSILKMNYYKDVHHEIRTLIYYINIHIYIYIYVYMYVIVFIQKKKNIITRIKIIICN